MGGFVYNSHTQGVFNIDIMRFNNFPEDLTANGENPNLLLRSYLTAADGECIPMYEFIGDRDQWTQTLLKAEQADLGDGNILKFVEEYAQNGQKALSPGELLIKDGKFSGFAPLDEQFEGVSYSEIHAALLDAGRNKHEDIKPQSPCDTLASNDPQATMKTSI